MPSGSWGARARSLLVPVLAFPVITFVAASILWLTIPARPVPINVRWTSDVTDAQRAGLERRFGLTDGHPTEGTTWAYTLADPSSANIRAIVQHQSVDDTAHVNRLRFRPAFAYDRPRRIAVFAVAVGMAGAVAARGALAVLRTPVLVAQPALVALAAAPPVIVAGAAGLVLMMAGVGYHPLWQEAPPATLPEAAVARDTVMVSKMIGGGADPDASAPVRLDERVAVLTPLEAAVLSRDVATVALLTKMGAHVDAATHARLACLARSVGANDIVDFLDAAHGNDPSRDGCTGVSLPAH